MYDHMNYSLHLQLNRLSRVFYKKSQGKIKIL